MSFFAGCLRGLTGLAVALAASSADVRADGLRLRWDHCDGGDQKSFDCLLNTADHPLALSLVTSAPVDSVLAVEVVLDLQADATALPAWWGLAPGGCRAGGVRADTQFPFGSVCADPWGGSAVSQVQAFLVTQPRGNPNQARIVAVVGVPSDQPVTFSAGSVYDVVRVVLGSQQTVGPIACTGCATPVCVVFNSARIVRLPQSVPVPDIPSDGGTDVWARWQGGTTASCLAVPVRNRTWGALKSLYR